MQRFMIAAVGAAVLGSACKVERTPAEYFDHQQWSATEASATAAELQDRILALGQAVGRRSVTEAMIALAPDQDAVVLTPYEGVVISGAAEIQQALHGVIGARRNLRFRKVGVTVNTQRNAAWFRAEVDARAPGAEEALPVLVTGVYTSTGGAWQLVQAHIANLQQPPSPSQP